MNGALIRIPFSALLSQWHPTRNGQLSLEAVTPGTKRKVWWQCAQGHEWLAAVGDRVRGRGCPYCAGHSVNVDNCLAAVLPAIARQWHPTKNGTLTPWDVLPGSRHVAWWICAHGHEWPAPVGRRFRCGCPYCAGRRVGPDNCLAFLRPDVAAEWHPEKNGRLSPTGFSCGSTRKVWWLCQHGHEWQASIVHRAKGRGCPFCSGHFTAREDSLAVLRPDLAIQWDALENSPLTPADVSLGSGKIVWWVCSRGHRWPANVFHRVAGSGCPYCLGRKLCDSNSLLSRSPAVAAEWHPTRNGELKPSDILPGSNRRYWWLCQQGHNWEATANMRTTRHTGCPYCTSILCSPERSLAARFPGLAREWHPLLNGRLRPDMVSPNSHRRPWWSCARGHAYQITVAYKVRGAGCPECERSNEPCYNETSNTFPR